MNLLARAAILIGKLASSSIKALRLGAGATWPGELALRIYPRILRYFASQHATIVLIAGTNGKTTTSTMVETILKEAGRRVRRNKSGANLDNGIVSTFIADTGFTGKLASHYFIFEVDEASLPIILKHLTPQVVVLNNLFRDQLDRYGEVDAIAEKWLTALRPLGARTTVVVNADDPHLTFIGAQMQAPVRYFGLEEPSLYLPKMQHATDTIYCPSCGHRLTFAGVYYSHLGKWACGKCNFVPPAEEVTARDFASPVEGVYNRYNTLAAALAARTLGLTDDAIRAGLAAFHPAFGRMETIERDGKTIKILLSKNPTGFNESLRTIAASSSIGPLLLVLNDRIPDGTDVSWIWDVDFEGDAVAGPIFVSGDRVYDMALRIKYAQETSGKGQETGVTQVELNLETAIAKALEGTREGETLRILPTYSAMLEVRKILLGRKIL